MVLTNSNTLIKFHDDVVSCYLLLDPDSDPNPNHDHDLDPDPDSDPTLDQ